MSLVLNGRPRGRQVARPDPTFSDYLRSDVFRHSRWSLSDEACTILTRANPRSLPALLRLCREHWPDAYRECCYMSGRTGSENTRQLWADYLIWKARSC